MPSTIPTPLTPSSCTILLIDNYDSFTFNLVQRFGELDRSVNVAVVRNDEIDVAEAERLAPAALVISPGPCTPRESGVSPQLITHFKGRIPILGVCLGHQAIGDAHGMTVRRNDVPVHGKTSPICHDNQGVFRGLSNPFLATRYHSLIVEAATVSEEFAVSAWTERGDVMGLRWLGAGSATAPMEGVQFHPESFLTVEGPKLLANFLAYIPRAPNSRRD
ncbi:MAG: aminodeoxychorismate/anthranilate synthase component II [Phycisphaerae bacterium]|nr:aminodeoxychorismate/anthranilate synthase component II [Phycisphaerae bacterium]